MKKPVITEFVIDQITELEDLKKLLPEVDDMAKERLKTLIEAEGIREPLSLAYFNDKNVLLDGHNRLRIARELGYMSVPAVFHDDIKDETSAEIWMVDNQLAKRNMDTMERIKIVLQLEPQLKAEAKERQRQGGQGVDISTPVGKVRDIIAEMAGKSSTIIRQAKQILDTKDESLIAIADKNISINRAYKLAKLSPDKREKKIAVILQKITEEEAVTATDGETETIIVNKTELTKCPEYADNIYIGNKVDDANYEVYGMSTIPTKEGHPRVSASLKVEHNRALVTRVPKYFGSYKNLLIFAEDDNSDSFNFFMSEVQTLINVVKTAKKLSDPVRFKAYQDYINAHPEIEDRAKAEKLAQKEQAKADKLVLKKTTKDNVLAEEVLKEKEAFATVHPSYYEFYLTLSKKNQKEVISSFYSGKHVSLVGSLNIYEYGNWLEKKKNKAERAKKKAARELEEKTGIPAMTAEEKEAISNLEFVSGSLALNDSYILAIEKDTTEGLVFAHGKNYLSEARALLAKAKEKASAPITTETPAPAPKKVATKKKPATKKPTEPQEAPEPTAVASKNKRKGSKRTAKK